MNREELFDYVKKEYGIEPDYPWKDHNAVLRHKKNKKWFAAIIEVAKNKLGLSGDEKIDVVNVKCDPMMVDILKGQEGFHPAYHMNKENWLSIRLDGTADADVIKNLLAESYSLTSPHKSMGNQSKEALFK